MGSFKLAKTPLGKSQYSSAHKLPIGKLDPRILKVSINSGKGMCLHDAAYTKTAANPEQGKTIDLNITSTAVTDKSGNGNHPTLSNVALLDGAMQFNGSTSIATIARNVGFETPSFSIFVRVKFNSFGDDESSCYLVDKQSYDPNGGGFLLFVTADGADLGLSIRDLADTAVYLTARVNFVLGVTYDILVTFEKYSGSGLGKASFYVNGVLKSTSECTKVYAYGTSNLRICDNGQSTRELNGSIFALRMYDYALSSAEAKSLSQSTEVTIIDDSQAAYWSAYTGGTGSFSQTLSNDSTEKASGADSLKIEIAAGSSSYFGVQKDLSADQDWRGIDSFSFWFYGAATGATWVFAMRTRMFWQGGAFSYSFVDDIAGWRKITIPKGSFSTPTIMNQGWAAIGMIFFYTLNPKAVSTVRFDHLTAIYNGSTKLYPSLDSLNFTWDKGAKKLSVEGLFLENQLEESPVVGDVLELSDDEANAWGAGGSAAAGSYGVDTIVADASEKVKGVQSWKMTVKDGASVNLYMFKTYGSNQNWSTYDFLSMWLFNSNVPTFQVVILAPDWSNYYYTYPTGSWTGWKRVVLPLRSFTTVGSPSLSTVREIQVRWTPTATSNIFRIDRVVLQKGRWCFVEIAVPDALVSNGNYTAGASTYIGLPSPKWVGYTWSGGAYGEFFPMWNAGGWIGMDNLSCYMLNGQAFTSIYGITRWVTTTLSRFYIGNKGEAKNQEYISCANTIIYNDVGGTKKRIGFAIKMPPADYVASSTTGISQCKLKLEIYYI